MSTESGKRRGIMFGQMRVCPARACSRLEPRCLTVDQPPSRYSICHVVIPRLRTASSPARCIRAEAAPFPGDWQFGKSGEFFVSNG